MLHGNHIRLTAMLVLLAGAFQTSCVREPAEQTEPTVLTVDPVSIGMTADRQKAEIEVRSDFAWRARMRDGSWCDIACVVSTDPSAAGKIFLNASFNQGSFERTDTVTVVSGSIEMNIPLIQSGTGSLVTPQELFVTSSAPSSFSVDTKETWSLELVPVMEGDDLAWLEVNPSSADAGHTVVSVSALSDNVNVGGRSAIIRLALGGGHVDVSVTQPQTDALVSSGDTVAVDFMGESFSVDMSHNVGYEVSLSPSAEGWLSHVRTRALDVTAERFRAQRNTSGVERVASIFFTSSSVADTVVVIQPAADYSFLNMDTYGAYELDGRNWTADAAMSQMGLKGYPDRYSFRILYPASSSVMEISGLKYSYADGDSAEITVSILSGETVSSETYRAKVIRQNETTLWLRSDGGQCFIIKTFEGR